MASMLEHLDRESMLLMYLAEELPAGERVEVERRLGQDEALARELDRLRELESYCEQTLSAENERLPMSSDAAVRRVSRAMKQWQVDRLARKPIATRRSHYRLPWWAYGTAVAAAVIVAALVWSSNLPDSSDNHPSPDQIAKVEDELIEDITKDWNEGFQQERDVRNAMLGEQLMPQPISDDTMNEVFMRDPGERS